MVRDSVETNSGDKIPQIDLRIPGPWANPMEIVEAIRQVNLGYEVHMTDRPEDVALIHTSSGARFGIAAIDPDDEIADIFAQGGRISERDVEAIRAHRVKVMISGPGGSVEAARAVMQAGAALVSAGGLGVMVDNSGVTHSPRDWLDLAGDEKLGGVYWGLVMVSASPEEVFSAGMHCLGFRDAEMPHPDDIRQCGMMLHEFLGYSYQSGATILDGQAIGGPEGAEFYVKHIPCTRFPSSSPWHNPYGIWRLMRIEEQG